MNRAQPGLNRAQPGLNRAHPGLNRAHPGLNRAHPGLNRAQPGRGSKGEPSAAEVLRAGRAFFERARASGRPACRELVRMRHAAEKVFGTCRWCAKPCAPRKRWHPFCARVYLAAKGQTEHASGGGRGLIPRQPCEACGGPASEIDHRIALGVALRLPLKRAWTRAWWIGNLRWMCRACHAQKTAADRRMMAALDRPPEADAHKQLQLPLGHEAAAPAAAGGRAS